MFHRLYLAIAVAMWAGTAWADAELHYGPPPAWVVPVEIPKDAKPAAGAPVQVLLAERQAFYGPEGDETYVHDATKVLTPQGLAAMGAAGVSWNPETETVTVHRVAIIRDGHPIDVLAKGRKLLVLRREQNLERATLDGRLTAAIQPEDLRVGDTLDLVMTIKRQDPVYKGRSEGVTPIAATAPIGRVYDREVWSPAKPIRWRASEAFGSPKVAKTVVGTEIVFDRTDFQSPPPPEDAPPRFRRPPAVEVTEFPNWSAVSELMDPLYRKASRLGETSPLKAEVARIRAAARAFGSGAALHLVQEQTRYLFLGMNLGGYIPADADTTWSRRFGDCKGKTALLLALLHELGIEAEPALVSTVDGDGLDQRLPQLSAFDHVLVRAVIGGRVYWLDGTRLGDRGLDDLRPPAFHWALPVRAAGAELERLSQPPLEKPELDQTLRIDASAGVRQPAPARLDLTAHGETGQTLRLAFGAMSQADSERTIREGLSSIHPWLAVEKAGFAYDEVHGEMHIWSTGAAALDWTPNGSVDELAVPESRIGWDASFHRDPGPSHDAPFALAYPSFSHRRTTIVLPAGGAGFTLAGAGDEDRLLAGYALKRRSAIEGGQAIVETWTRSTTDEVPAAQAEADAPAFRALASSVVVLRASLPEHVGASVGPPTPTTAAGFSDVGVQALLNGELDAAIAAFDKAAALDPASPKHPYNRGVAHFQKGEMRLARADFDRALMLKPDHGLALLGRAEASLALGDTAAAERDFDTAIRLAPEDLVPKVRRGEAYARVSRYDAAVQIYDALLAQQPPQGMYGRLLSDRCNALARWGRRLERGLADCEAALAGAPSPAAREGRALARLRLGQYEGAASDFDSLVQARPKDGEALFGRGLAKLREGRKADGQADLDAAGRLDPKVVATFAGYGLRP